MSKCHMRTKKTSQKWTFDSNKKLGLEWTVNGLGKPFIKNPIQKTEKYLSEIAACEQKITSEKAHSCSDTFLSLYLKIRAKISQTTRFFAQLPDSEWLKSLFQFDFKNHQNVWSDP